MRLTIQEINYLANKIVAKTAEEISERHERKRADIVNSARIAHEEVDRVKVLELWRLDAETRRAHEENNKRQFEIYEEIKRALFDMEKLKTH